MVEFLALPAPGAPSVPPGLWLDRLRELGHSPTFTRDGSSDAWIEIAAMRVRGFVVWEGPLVEAINFELHAPDPSPALALIEDAARGLGWEIHPDDGDDD